MFFCKTFKRKCPDLNCHPKQGSYQGMCPLHSPPRAERTRVWPEKADHGHCPAFCWGGVPEVLTHPCEKNRHSEIFRKEFSDLEGGGGQWYLAVKQQSTAHEMNYILISSV